jgi:hypothetical protein
MTVGRDILQPHSSHTASNHEDICGYKTSSVKSTWHPEDQPQHLHYEDLRCHTHVFLIPKEFFFCLWRK